MKHILQQNQQITSNSPQLALLKQQFPQCFDQHGAFMPHKLQEVVQASGLALSTEGYSLNWLGKSYARLLANLNVQTFLQANTAHNSKPENQNSQNMLIKGDNLEVLKHLSAAYRESVKMIYIDPPYNTGSDGFVYQDDRRFTAAQLVQMTGMGEEEARRILEFTQSKSNSHSAWLTFMYPRLYVARRLLRDDGVIFISIDDNEQAQLKLLCDEVFGEENFVGCICWAKKRKGSFLSKKIVSLTEYVLIYSKGADVKIFGGKPNDLESQPIVKRTNSIGILKFSENIIKTKLNDGVYKKGIYGHGSSSVQLLEDARVKSGVFVSEVLLKGPFTWSQKNLDEQLKKGCKVLINTNNFQLRVFKAQDEDAFKGLASLIIGKELSATNEDGYEELLEIFDVESIFDYPKPVAFIKYLLNAGLCLEQDCLILDFFAGSGTTAHAVMQLNAEDGGNRRYICVQLDEATDPKSEAHKAGYHSIYDITAERIQRAAAKIRTEYPDYTGDPQNWGFQQFSTIPVFDGYLDPIDLDPQFNLFDPSNLSNQDRQNLMLTWQAADAIPLTQALTPVPLGDYTAYLGTANSGSRYLYALEPHLNLDAILVLFERLDHDPTFSVQYLVTLGYALDSRAQREISEAIHHYQNRKGIELQFDIRF